MGIESQAPRILSVLAGGNERQIPTHDQGLERNYTIINVVNHTTTMHTLAFEHLAKSNPSVSFIHAYPGWVRTDILGKRLHPQTWSMVCFNLHAFQMDGSMGLESLWDFPHKSRESGKLSMLRVRGILRKLRSRLVLMRRRSRQASLRSAQLREMGCID